jgi:hypothetical protein
VPVDAAPALLHAAALTLVHQGVLYLHLVAFAIAFAAVAREDLAVLRTRRIDLPRLAATARVLVGALALLWLSGAALLWIDVGPDLQAVLESPKRLAKILVVSALTANGLALHWLAFPMLREARGSGVRVPVALGAVSSVSWAYASFVGVARVVAPAWQLGDFMALYGALLVASVGGALVFVRPSLLERRFS